MRDLFVARRTLLLYLCRGSGECEKIMAVEEAVAGHGALMQHQVGQAEDEVDPGARGAAQDVALEAAPEVGPDGAEAEAAPGAVRGGVAHGAADVALAASGRDRGQNHDRVLGAGQRHARETVEANLAPGSAL